MSQMCPNCSFDNPDEAKTCSNCPTALRGLLGADTVLAGRYKLVSVLGCGAMGAVYLAEDQRLVGRRCAIKQNRHDPNASVDIQAQSREQFLAEARILARLDHPGLPKVSDYFIEDDNEFLVMDYVEGEDLQSLLLRSGRPLEEQPVLEWADQVLDALIYLHNQPGHPIIHRDIKPANIRLNLLQNRVKLVDFGLVKLFDADNPETKVELRGIGTPAYAPLEQFASSEQHTDARSDIYALGATMYHLLTNFYPPDVHQRVLNPEVLPPLRQMNPQLSENTERAVLRAMEIHPNQRFQTAEKMREALQGRGQDAAALPVPARTKATRKGSVAPLLFGVLGGIIVLLLLGGVYFLFLGQGGRGAETQAAVVEGGPELTPTDFVVQGFSDVPTDTPTPTVEATPTVVVEATAEPTATPTPAPTNTPAAEVTVSGGIAASSLSGTIAYSIFNGTDYDLFFAQADGSGAQLFRRQASQPAFSPDGSRIAFHSWRLDGWGLMTMNISGGGPILIARFVEDQLPTWTADGQAIVFLSRRQGDRKSRLMRVGSEEVGSEGIVLGEGEYPTIGLNGQLVFRGWGSTAPGLRQANTSLQGITPITDSDDDTAPALSPDGSRIVFMSRRSGNWELYVINADGSNPQRITDNPTDDGLPTWSPDGSLIAFVTNREGEWAVWVTTPDGSQQQELFKMGGSPDGFVGNDINASRGWLEERISWIP